MVPNLTGYRPEFGTKVTQTEENLGGLSTEEVNANVMMSFIKQRPITIGSTCETTKVEFDAKLYFSNLLQDTITLTLKSESDGGVNDPAYVGCLLVIYNVSDFNQEVVAGSSEWTLEPNSLLQLVWNGTQWVSLQTKISTVEPNEPTSGDIWIDSND